MRVLFALAQPAFRFSPRPLWAWRRFLLRRFGARIGPEVHIYPTVRIVIPWMLDISEGAAVGDRVILYALGPISIGERTNISQNAHLCAGTHDWRDPAMPLIKSGITIEDDAWICADAFIGPGVHVGARTIVGARTCVLQDLDADVIAQGNPATTRPRPGVDNV